MRIERERERKLVAIEEVGSIEKSANTRSTPVHGEIFNPPGFKIFLQAPTIVVVDFFFFFFFAKSNS